MNTADRNLRWEKGLDASRRKFPCALIMLIALGALVACGGQATTPAPSGLSPTVPKATTAPPTTVATNPTTAPPTAQPAAAAEPLECSGDKDLICKADQTGVILTIPNQGRIVKVETLEFGDLPSSDQDQFLPRRPVINFEVVEGSDGKTIVEIFQPAIELEVKYTVEDYKNAAEGLDNPTPDQILQNLVLGYWDGKRWVAFTNDKHNFTIQPDANPETGVGRAKISNWNDRRIGWGHKLGPAPTSKPSG
jgi:hypothetical protein